MPKELTDEQQARRHKEDVALTLQRWEVEEIMEALRFYRCPTLNSVRLILKLNAQADVFQPLDLH